MGNIGKTMADATISREVLLDKLAAPVFVKNPDGVYRYANEMACLMFGRPSSEIIGCSDRQLFGSELAARMKACDDRLLADGEHHACEFVLPDFRDGGERCYWIVRQVLRNAEGQVVGLSSVATDITERKRQEGELVALKNKFAATLQALPDLMFELDIEGRYLDCHTQQAFLLAAMPDNLIGRTVHEVLPPDVADTCIRALHEALDNGISTGQQFQLALPGSTRWFELSVAQ